MSFIESCFERTRTVLLAFFMLVIFGAIAYVEIPKEAEPDINIPYIFVNITHRGISPEDAERLLIKPMETELRSVEGVKEMTATAAEGSARLVLEFEAGFNADQALIDVREAVDKAKPDLPEDSDEPTVDELNFSQFPIIVATLTGEVPERTLLKIANDLQDSLEAIPEVLEANIAGERDEQVDIIVDPAMIEGYQINASEIATFLSRSNKLVAAGSMDNGKGKFSIKVPGLLETVQDIMDLPIKVYQDAVVKLQDIATGRRTYVDRTTYDRVNERSSISLEISKRTGTNLINTVEKVKKVIAREKKFWPENLSVSYNQDKSIDIKTRLEDLQNNVIASVILVMAVVIAALGIRTGLLVGISIPGSFLMAILAISVMGYTINMVVLFGLILSVGMLVDGAIVVTEFADRKMTEGIDKKTAYALASKRMAWPVIASTATTLAAFLPLAFWTGIVGEFMRYMPITVLCSLTASLIMALIFIPTFGAIFGKAGNANPKVMRALAASEKGDVTEIGGPTGVYAHILKSALSHPGKIVLSAFVILIISQISYGVLGKGIEFFPHIEPENATVKVHARGNLSIDEKDAIFKEVEQKIDDLDDFKTVYTRVGTQPRNSSEDVIGYINLEFKDWQIRRKASVVLGEIRKRLENMPGVVIEISEEKHGPSKDKPIVIELSSRDYTELPDAVAHIVKGMNAIGELSDIEDSRPIPGIEWEMEIDRSQAAKYNVDVSSLGNIVQMVTNGWKFSSYRPDDSDDEIDIVTRFPEQYRSISQLQNLRITTSSGSIPISSFVTLKPKPKVSKINRTDSKRVLEVKADVLPGVLADTKLKELKTWLTNNPLKDTIIVKYKGDDEEQKKSQAFLVKAFSVAMFLMALILVTQFNSFYSTLLILSAVILSTVGVLWGLIITGQPFGIVMSGIGVISLAGIVVNNNIVLIDTYDLLKKQFPTAFEAALRTGVQRLRPVFLTTVTTILGLVPMALSVNIDFVNRDVSMGAPSMQWWKSLSIAVVSGLTFATILTLIVTPCALVLWANFINWINKKTGKDFNY